MHPDGQHALLAHAEETHGGTHAVRCLKMHVIAYDFHIFIRQSRREIARERSRAADHGISCLWDFLIRHTLPLPF